MEIDTSNKAFLSPTIEAFTLQMHFDAVEHRNSGSMSLHEVDAETQRQIKTIIARDFKRIFNEKFGFQVESERDFTVTVKKGAGIRTLAARHRCPKRF